MTAARYAVWWEMLPYAELTDAAIGQLAARDIGIYLAVTPDTIDGIDAIVSRCLSAGLRVGIWPMIERSSGRWPSATNLDRFEEFVHEVLGRLGRHPHEVVIDLEPPIDVLPALTALDLRAIAQHLRRGVPAAATQHLRKIGADIRGEGMDVVVAAFPLVLCDGRSRGWQRFLGTPVDGVPASLVSAMLYTSIIEGLGRGRLDRVDAVDLLRMGARAAKKRFGSRASVSIGIIDTGALGDEPTYRDIDELREDVAAVKAEGIAHIVLFSLCGLVRRAGTTSYQRSAGGVESPGAANELEHWLDVLVNTPPAAARAESLRAKGAAMLGWVLARVA